MENIKTVKSKLTVVLLSILLVFGSCNSSKTLKGGAIGAGTGAVIGGLIGKKTDKTAQGAIIGAAVGGAAGAVIGKYMDKQAEELQKEMDNATVERVGEGIKVTMNSGILFDFDSFALKPEARVDLTSMAKVLNKYPETELLVEGHTDNVGRADYNQRLSEQRAKAVSDFLKSLKVESSRISQVGHGLTMPVADNSTEAGRRLNRRVEIAIVADENLKKKAEEGNL
jgi:outer membrane protein OmpA-like peptidoglycan-associated protein